jgi:hypothetical protein
MHTPLLKTAPRVLLTSLLSAFSATALIACGDEDTRTCTGAGCGESFLVRLRGAAFEARTRLEVEVGGQTATLDCPRAPEPQRNGRCVPFETTTDDYVLRAELWNTAGVFLNVTVREIGSELGPSAARIVLSPEGGEPVFDESFEDIDYGEGYEINGPGCGLCYGPVEFERQIPDSSSSSTGDGGL